MTDSTCYLERFAVRQVLMGVGDDQVEQAEEWLAEIDALPITTATDLQNAEIDRLSKLRDELARNAGHHLANECAAQAEIERLRAKIGETISSLDRMAADSGSATRASFRERAMEMADELRASQQSAQPETK